MRTRFRRALAAGVFLAAGASAQTAPDAAERANVAKMHDRIVARQANKTGPYKVTIPNTTVTYDMVAVPAGEFLMGSPATDPRAKKDEQPQHKVRLGTFWMQAHEVTWDQAMNGQEKLFPDHLDWNGSLAVQPRAEPGVTKLL